MNLSEFHFSHPMWLGAGIIIPLLWIIFFLFYKIYPPTNQLEKFIDRHLLPYLLVQSSNKKPSLWRALLLWSILWMCLTFALAGPRWNYREMETFSRDQTIVILLDVSESMNSMDVKPSRLIRAKQKIEDFINESEGVKIGLLLFAADPHMIAPVTEDKEIIRDFLPSLNTDLVYVQGSRLLSALQMASAMLEREPGNNKSIILMSDGGFEDASAITEVKKIVENGIVIHTLGFGTNDGAPLQDSQGNIRKKNQVPIISRLESNTLKEMSRAGNGLHFEGNALGNAEEVILKNLSVRADAELKAGTMKRFWEESFYLLLIPVLPIMLWWFRRGFIFAGFIILLHPSLDALENSFFKNCEERGQEAFEKEEYETAIETFQDSYRKGVAHYKAGNFLEAERLFKESSREEVASSAAFNRGNALVKQQKLQEAITAYESVLEKWPDHTKARENLAIIKKIVEQNQQDSSSSSDSEQSDKKEKNENESKEKNENEKSDTSSDKSNEGKENNSDTSDSEDKENKDESNEKKKNDSEQLDEKDPNDKPEMDQKSEKDKESEKDSRDSSQAENKKNEEMNAEQQAGNAEKVTKSQEEKDADLWLNRLENDQESFLKNKFLIESKRNGTKEGLDPW